MPDRAAFEAWYEGRALECGLEHSNWFRRDDDRTYKIGDVQSSWDAWQEAVRQERDLLEAAFLWCLTNLTEYAHHQVLTDPSNGVMRAYEAVLARRGKKND